MNVTEYAELKSRLILIKRQQFGCLTKSCIPHEAKAVAAVPRYGEREQENGMSEESQTRMLHVGGRKWMKNYMKAVC
eukprot:CAMPEP_0119129704 /NCGR_PEP_ID=MMETSP1310-20130426/7338_1 /TAXON_ID=464262 /ORGANISM="Genus nov. species nov., Strain RCC2339" /LENGTH=76 /DNA_ID=CAMNT_0007120141 /DNA_START=516 /DNA_END=746 /DNA_ORIENTATION=-